MSLHSVIQPFTQRFDILSAYEVNNLGRISADLRWNSILFLLAKIDHQGHTHDQRPRASS